MSIKVKNEPGLIRDDFSKGIISTDSGEYKKYLLQREQLRRTREQNFSTASEISDIKQELKELKDLVFSLITIINNKTK